MHPMGTSVRPGHRPGVPRDRPVNRMSPDPVPRRPYAELTIAGLVARARMLSGSVHEPVHGRSARVRLSVTLRNIAKRVGLSFAANGQDRCRIRP
jgi:hypothetical protein